MANRPVLDRVPDTRPTLPAWGVEAVIDLYGCDPGALTDDSVIRGFLATLVPAIGMKAHGEPEVELFGQGSLHGHSAKQWIETSSIVLHTDVPGRRCFINVFSCKKFDPEVAAQTAFDHFGGWAAVTVLQRGAAQ